MGEAVSLNQIYAEMNGEWIAEKGKLSLQLKSDGYVMTVALKKA